MLGLPEQTVRNKSLPKTTIFQKLSLNFVQREKFDADISRIYIANEISENTVNIASGENIKSIFLLHIILKQENIDQQNIIMLSKLIPQNIVYLLEFEGKYKLAIFHTKLLITDWTSSPTLPLQGLDLDKVWAKFVMTVEGGSWTPQLSIEENLALHDKQKKTQTQIEALEKKLWNTKQFNQQVKIKNEIKQLRELLKMIGNTV